MVRSALYIEVYKTAVIVVVAVMVSVRWAKGCPDGAVQVLKSRTRKRIGIQQNIFVYR